MVPWPKLIPKKACPIANKIDLKLNSDHFGSNKKISACLASFRNKERIVIIISIKNNKGIIILLAFSIPF